MPFRLIKNKFFIVFCLIFMNVDIYSAEYKGNNIDGNDYSCSAYSYKTHKYYNVIVEFDSDEAKISFKNGGFIILTLENEQIDDLSSIDAYDYKTKIHWELDVDDLD